MGDAVSRVYIKPYEPTDSPYGNDGTPQRPLSGSNLSILLGSKFRTDRLAVFVFLPGDYTTTEIQLPRGSRSAFIAKEAGTVKITGKATGDSITKIFGERSGVSEFYLYGLELDGDIKNDKTFENLLHIGSYKVSPVSVRAWRGKVEQCTVTGHGADGRAHTSGWECFPLRLETYRGGAPFGDYEPAFVALKGEPTPCVEIRECVVHGGTYTNGGYSTDIFLRTCQPGEGDRFGPGIRDSVSGQVVGCQVDDPGAIAYGCAESEGVIFEDNLVLNAKCAFNFDTGSLYHCDIANNAFGGVNQGISLVGASRGVRVEKNTIHLTQDPFHNAVTGKDEAHFSFLIKNTTNFVSDHNDVWVKGRDFEYATNTVYAGALDDALKESTLFAPDAPDIDDDVEAVPGTSQEYVEGLLLQVQELESQLAASKAAVLHGLQVRKETNEILEASKASEEKAVAQVLSLQNAMGSEMEKSRALNERYLRLMSQYEGAAAESKKMKDALRALADAAALVNSFATPSTK
jgi:hypothetical protein